MRFRVAQRQEREAGREVGVSFHPAVVRVHVRTVRFLLFGQRGEQIGAPIMRRYFRVDNLRLAQRVERLGESVVVVPRRARPVTR